MMHKMDVSVPGSSDGEDSLRNEFLAPPDGFGPLPFWFWNGDISESGIGEQLGAFHQAGVAGVVLHPRIGMSRKIPYLSDRFMELAEYAVNTAQSLGLQVMLYDEAMYPSGSAHGMVVAANPEHASMGLRITEIPVAALAPNPPRIGSVPVRAEAGHARIALLAIHHAPGQEADFRHPCGDTAPGFPENPPDPIAMRNKAIVETDTLVLSTTHTGVGFSAPEGEDWSLLLCERVPTGGTIRGLHAGEDDGEPGAPASADLLNPDAVRSFLSITHERYASRLGSHFGSTIPGFFTDEPSLPGRNAAPDLVPWTHDFINDWLEQGLRVEDIALLRWDSASGDRHMLVRSRFRKALAERLGRTYYAALSHWCEAHHLLLAGHPEGSMDVGTLRHFGIPGQDLVWRWVSPEGDSALMGPHSTMAKSTADLARRWGKRRNANECFGCCGPAGIQWAFSADDMKWMLDWLFVRGTNLIIPHAFFYSLDGPIRYGERPPDVGPNNLWWPEYPRISAYIRRLSWLRTDSRELATVAVLCREDWVPWRSVAPLYRNQIGFQYVEESDVCANGVILEHGLLEVGADTYAVLVMENPSGFSPEAHALMARFQSAGGCVLPIPPEMDPSDLEALPSRIRDHVRGQGEGDLLPSVHPSCGDLRMAMMEKGGDLFFLLTNEGEAPVETTLAVSSGTAGDRWEQWNPWAGTIRRIWPLKPHPLPIHGKSAPTPVSLSISLERRESMVVRRVRGACPAGKEEWACIPSATRDLLLDLSQGWTISGASLSEAMTMNRLEPWEHMPSLSGLAGTIRYVRLFSIQPVQGARYELDLGDVGELARVRVNGRDTDCRLWRPYVYDVTALLRDGENHLLVEVTNSLAHRYEAEAVSQLSEPLPRLRSGLLGPVRLWRVPGGQAQEPGDQPAADSRRLFRKYISMSVPTIAKLST